MQRGGRGLRLNPAWVVVTVSGPRKELRRVGNYYQRDQPDDPAVEIRLTQVVVGVGVAQLGGAVAVFRDNMWQTVLGIGP